MKFLLLSGVIVLASVLASEAQVFSLLPSADVLLSAANPNVNYGGAGALAVSASGLPKGEFDSLLQFDFAAAKSSFDAFYGAGAWDIQSITLTLTASPPNNALFNGNGAGPGGTNVNTAGLFSLQWLANDSWIEGTGSPAAPSATGINFNGLPALRGGSDEALGTFTFNGSNTSSTAYILALPASFLAEAESGGVATFLALPADASVAMLVNSRTGALSARPVLTVAAVPEPGSAMLALAGLPVFCRRLRRS